MAAASARDVSSPLRDRLLISSLFVCPVERQDIFAVVIVVVKMGAGGLLVARAVEMWNVECGEAVKCIYLSYIHDRQTSCICTSASPVH